MGDDPVLYQIRVDGHLGPTLLTAFPAFVPEQQGSETVLTGLLPDAAALFGVLAVIEAVGLGLRAIRTSRTGLGRTSGVCGRTTLHRRETLREHRAAGDPRRDPAPVRLPRRQQCRRTTAPARRVDVRAAAARRCDREVGHA